MNKKYLIMTVLAGFSTVQTHAVSQKEVKKAKKSDQPTEPVLQKLIDYYEAMLPKIEDYLLHLHDGIDYMKQEEDLMEKEGFLTRQELEKVNQMRKDADTANKRASQIATDLVRDCKQEIYYLTQERNRMEKSCQTERDKDLIMKVQNGINMLKAMNFALGGYKGAPQFEGLDKTKDTAWWNAHTRFQAGLKRVAEARLNGGKQTGGVMILGQARREWEAIVKLQKERLDLEETVSQQKQAQEPHNEQDLQRLDQVKDELQDLQKRMKTLKAIKETYLLKELARLTEQVREQMKVDDKYMNDLDVKLQKKVQKEQSSKKAAEELLKGEQKKQKKQKKAKENALQELQLQEAIPLSVPQADQARIETTICVQETFTAFPVAQAEKETRHEQRYKHVEKKLGQPFLSGLKPLNVVLGQAQQQLQDLQREQGWKKSRINTHGGGTSFSCVKEESGRINKQRGQNTNAHYSAPAEEESKESASINTATVKVFCDSPIFFTDQSFVSSSNGPKEGGGEKMQEQHSKLKKMVEDVLNDNT